MDKQEIVYSALNLFFTISFLVTCRVDNDCFLGHVCLNKMCLVGCREPTDCPSTLSCIANQCRSPCESASCGPNAQCQAIEGKAFCTCNKGYSPNPSAVVGCSREPISCVSNKQCPNNFQCDKDFCRPVCSVDKDCPAHELCVGSLCQEIC